MKGIKIFKEEDNQMIKKLNYISNLNKNQKEINLLFQKFMKGLNISYNQDVINYEEYYFSGLPIPKDIKIYDITGNGFKVSWKIDDIQKDNMSNKQIKYELEIKKENDKFKSIYNGTDDNYTINNLDENANYEIKVCSIYNNIKSNYSEIYKIKTDILDSIILNKNERKKEFIDKILEWSGTKSMKLIYRGTRDGMTSKDFHNKCDNKGKTICLFLNDKGNIFGGYSSIPWTSNGGNEADEDCFIFTLTNIYNTEPTKFPYLKDRSVYHSESYGPLFGGGSDLGLGSNFISSNGSWSSFPYSYKDILNKGKSIFTGDLNNDNSYYLLKEIEIFETL